MAGYEELRDPADPRLADYLSLTDVQLRRRMEPAEGLFVAEGEKVIRRALAAGYPMRSMVLEERWLGAMRDVVDGTSAPVYVALPDVLKSATGYLVHRGALAAMGRKPLPTPATLLAGAARVLVLEEVNDHTNTGLVFRSAAALGMDAVLLCPRSADPLYRRAIKTSMGAVFAMPWGRFSSWPAGLETVKNAGFRLLALTPRGETSLPDLAARPGDRLALLLGSEGQGLSSRVLELADVRVSIPMHAGVDSLNVAATAAIACYCLGVGRT